MGVKDLNSIVRRQHETVKHNFETIIIDGTNMIITFLSKVSSELQKHDKTIFNTVDMNIIVQMKYIITKTTEYMFNVIKRFYNDYSPDKIYFVMDPKDEVSYVINSDMIIFDKYKELLLKDSNEICYELKKEEKEARKKANSKKEFVYSKWKKIHDEYNDNILPDIFRQTFHFNEQSNLFRLIKVCIRILSNDIRAYLSENLFRIINTGDEADLVIKNIGEMETNNSDKKVLICSSDTDYFVLFSNNPNIYIGGLRSTDFIYSPIKQWREAFTVNGVQMIPDNMIYNYAIRLSAIFGNDYTRDTIITSREYINCIKVFIPKLFKITSHRSNIDKFITKELCDYPDDKTVIDYNKFDELIEDWLEYRNNQSHFKLYIFSVIVYSNYQYYNKYSIEDEIYDIDSLVIELLGKLFVNNDNEKIFDNKILFSKYDVLYDWSKLKITKLNNETENETNNYEIDCDIKQLPTDITELLEIYKNISITQYNEENEYYKNLIE